MKKKFFLPIILLLTAIILYSFNNPQGHSQNISPKNLSYGNEFLIGAMNTGKDQYLAHMDSLGFNLWHKYADTEYNDSMKRVIPKTSNRDKLHLPIDTYKVEINAQLQEAVSGSLNMKAVMTRPKLEWLCFGQRSDYQCEAISKADDNQWFYSFRDQDGVGSPTPDSGAMVKHCEVNNSLSSQQNAGWVVKGLKANTEQSNPGGYKGDSLSTWFIKPRIRINVADTANRNKLVCRIDVRNEFDSLIMRDTLKVFNFLNNAGKYEGQYLEEFYNLTDSLKSLKIKGNWGRTWYNGARGELPENSDTVKNHADIQVYWYGECDMWIDYVRVDDDIAHSLFGTGILHDIYMDWLNWEATEIASHTAAYRFYLELFEYNNVPCMSYVSRMMDSIVYENSGQTKHFTLLCIPIPTHYVFHVPWKDRLTVYSVSHFKKYFLEKMGPMDFIAASYPFSSSYVTPEVYTKENTWTRIPNTLPIPSGTTSGLLAPQVEPAEYDTWLQHYLDSIPYFFEPGHSGQGFDAENEPGHFRFTMKRADTLSKLTGIPFIFNAQGHIWKLRNGNDPLAKSSPSTNPVRYAGEVQREPTNEEMDLTVNVPITYGAKGIMYFEYTTDKDTQIGSEVYDRGLVNYGYYVNEFLYGGSPRYDNIYGQPKWNKLKEISRRVKKWGPYLMSFDDVNRHSYIYRIEKTAMASGSFINDIITKDITLHQDSSANRYVQAAVFNNDSADTRYFMIVNRRCSPVDTSSAHNDGKRFITVRFDANSGSFANFNNWKIIDLETDATVTTFDKTVSSYLDLGWFNPGQGKLYKVIPVMKAGGTFAGNEFLSNITFNNSGTVYTNGYNLTLHEGVNISFTDSSQIVMHKGKFASGLPGGREPLPIMSSLRGQPGKRWLGIKFDSTRINMNYTRISDVRTKYSENHGYALYAVNPDTLKVTYSRIIPMTHIDSSTSGILLVYTAGGSNRVINIDHDSINVSNYDYALNLASNSSLSGSYNVSNNVFINDIGAGAAVILDHLNDVTVFANQMLNWSYGVYAFHASPDMWANYITAYNPVKAEGSSILDASSNAGGFNTFYTSTGRCVDLLSSYMDIHGGGNVFNKQDTSTNYFFAGNFPSDKTSTYENGRGNCFMTNNFASHMDSAHVKYNVTLSDNTTHVYYRLLYFICPDTSIHESINKNVITDNIRSQNNTREKGITSESKLSTNTKLSSFNAADDAEYKIQKSSELYSEMKTALRSNDYSLAAERCKSILELGVDNMYSLDAVRKLLHCAAQSNGQLVNSKQSKTSIVQPDSKLRIGKETKQQNGFNKTSTNEGSKTQISSFAVSSMSDLKSYYESYIQRHPENKTIVNEMFYYIQKCKVNLGDYESALNGYKAIMENNPGSMAGLSAKWEYTNLHLLMTSKGNTGKGGGEENTELENTAAYEQQHERLMNIIAEGIENNDGPKDGKGPNKGPKDGKEKYDDKKFTKEDRKVITNNIVSSLETNGKQSKTRLKTLEEKVAGNTANQSETAEYKKMMLLKELIKIEKVNSTDEQVNMMQSDLKKILALDSHPAEILQQRVTPVVAYDYKLNQNYPNPFNPSTKINYELKNAGFVSLKIYDLLGREIAELVNETKDAGRYTVDFNANRYMMASGIYFYRIKAGEFIDTKRMVLVK